jgi:tetratricopeptide (TPR) repeat protein
MTAQPEAAVASLSWSTSLSPGDDFCLAKLGMAAEAVADLSKEPEQRLQALNAALRAFKKAVELVPENSYHYANLGRLLAKLIPFGRATPQASFEVIERGLAKDPNNADLLYDAANTALSVNDLPKADFYARNAVTRFPGFAPCQAQLGFIASMNNELERAGFLLRESLGGDWRGRNADQIVARGNLASVLLRLGRAEEALPIAREAAEGAPASADFRFNLARALELSGHRQAAVDEYRRLTAEHPAFLRARKALRSLEEISAEVDGRWEEKASKEAAITDATGDL